MAFVCELILFLSGAMFGIVLCILKKRRFCRQCRLDISSTYTKLLAQYKGRLDTKDQEIDRLHDALLNEQIKNANLLRKLGTSV